MRHSLITRLLSSAAVVAGIALAGLPAAKAEDAPAAAAEETVKFDPQSVNSFSGAFLAARTADVDKDYETAIALYRITLQYDPTNTEVKERLMITLLLNGDFEEGVKLAQALKDDPAVERITTVVRGMDAIRKREYRTAEKILVYSGPNDLDRMMNGLLVAWAKFGDGKTKQALATISDMEGPDWFAIFKNYNAGAIAAAAGDRDTARKRLNDAILDRNGGAAAPDTFMRAVMALARLEAREGNKQKALDAISVGENLVSSYAPLKALRESIERGDKQEQQVRTAAQGAASVLFSIGGALNREGAEDIVSLYLQVSRALDPESADTLVLLGGLAESQKKPDLAIEFYRQVPENSPMRRLSELQLGLQLADLGKVDEAKKHLKELIEADPKDMRSYLAYGSVLSDAKEYKEMGEVYDRAVDQMGNVPNKSQWTIYFQRGIAYERQKKWEQAEPNFRKALDLNPDQPQVLNYLGYSWVDMNINLDEGLEMIRKAVSIKPDDGYIVDSLGWAYYRLGQYEDAVTELERAAELRAGDPTINDHLGDAYWRVGRKLEATFQWNRALGLKPEEAEIPKIKAKIENGLADEKPAQPAAAQAIEGKEPVKTPSLDVTEPEKKS
ncbi:tetratricopeptide repeat protein [Mycoplana rhizolycopersici]|uniref:Tetratricopeptide repeat protein n=1 Tax=Mycoplana rhizolycopersici TaxID=2746702 RepID=A0ABX2QGD2_9HYPH|nr:tetratricopeptide repeat protein [Rhizobium rhizolycopersici]NVP56278.1 tetratricopeptide repeat protein [Rhizobium rhizolycopersici]